MSHLNIKSLKKNIIFIRKYTKTPICIDTEGAQIRTKIAKRKFFKKGIKIEIFKGKKNLYLYPAETKNLIKKGDILDIGFEGLKIKIIKKNPNNILHTS